MYISSISATHKVLTTHQPVGLSAQIAAGVQRLYQGLFPWAIFQAPLSRFGDVAANDMVLVLMGAFLPQAES